MANSDRFRFELGDVVTMRVVLAECMATQGVRAAYDSSGFSAPLAFSVSERRVQECPGGTQRHYLLATHKSEPLLVLEDQVVAYDDAVTVLKGASTYRSADAFVALDAQTAANDKATPEKP